MIPAAASKGDGWGREQRTSQGRRIVADLDLQGSEVVLREQPWAMVLLASEMKNRCDWSLTASNTSSSSSSSSPSSSSKALPRLQSLTDTAAAGSTGRDQGSSGDAESSAYPMPPLFRCSATGNYFAGKKERMKAQGEYLACETRACAALAASGRSFAELPPSIRLCSRALWRGACGEGSDGSIPWLGLEDHWHSLPEARRGELRGMGELVASLVAQGLPKERGVRAPDAMAAARLLAVIAVNAMIVTDEEYREVGLALYINASAFNHSEEPNCSQSFEGRDLVVRARGRVQKGVELTITYSELAESSCFRREQLKKQYLFAPSLTQSVRDRDRLLEEIEEIGERGRSTSSHFLPWHSERGFVPQAQTGDWDLEEWASELDRLLKEVEAASEQGSPSSALSAARRLWEQCCVEDSSKKWRLGKGHALRLHLARLGMDLAVASQRWEEALAWARAVCQVEALVYPSPWPVVACSQGRLAKLELYANNFKAAAAASTSALRDFAALGIDNSLCQELRQIAAQAAAERRCQAQAMAEEEKKEEHAKKESKEEKKKKEEEEKKKKEEEDEKLRRAREQPKPHQQPVQQAEEDVITSKSKASPSAKDYALPDPATIDFADLD